MPVLFIHYHKTGYQLTRELMDELGRALTIKTTILYDGV
eukprot:CAMPEP_0181239508 /NCGR_PEP_ID=MMETSP1096-20121128/39977_1 /TAXON_ID=156174 ORGANISM="Chrysochromulina ericina, Strain CCMP281" /NCGR_SAMPLE_ID=MMETSP1096 /ASSEMBLY_ACC=CAM_ASM_000453 /LENGTH=38 /DNA_ID= /DNA_START= /DNA_END= /DNA_ORIENTATION=